MRLLVARLERARRRRARGVERRQQRARERDDRAGDEVQGCRQQLKGEVRGDAAELAGAEVRAGIAQREQGRSA